MPWWQQGGNMLGVGRQGFLEMLLLRQIIVSAQGGMLLL